MSVVNRYITCEIKWNFHSPILDYVNVSVDHCRSIYILFFGPSQEPLFVRLECYVEATPICHPCRIRTITVQATNVMDVHTYTYIETTYLNHLFS
jgi:hypothetical protein